MNDYTVYVHIAPNNKMYIGITHLKPNYRYGRDGNGYSGCTLFWRAIQKYGWDNIKHIVLLENLSKEVACECEKYLIAKYQTNNSQFGYNNSRGGDSGSYGHKMSEESKAKISKAMKGRKLSEETKRKVGEANSKALKGRHVADDVKKKISEHTKGKNNPFYGKHHTEESKKKMSNALKGNKSHLGHKHSDETRQKMRLAKLGKKRGPWTDAERKAHMEAIERKRKEKLQSSYS